MTRLGLAVACAVAGIWIGFMLGVYFMEPYTRLDSLDSLAANVSNLQEEIGE